jgi:hypothetical protein
VDLRGRRGRRAQSIVLLHVFDFYGFPWTRVDGVDGAPFAAWTPRGRRGRAFLATEKETNG